jgi:predicted protein tyrosine phosphatase
LILLFFPRLVFKIKQKKKAEEKELFVGLYSWLGVQLLFVMERREHRQKCQKSKTCIIKEGGEVVWGIQIWGW